MDATWAYPVVLEPDDNGTLLVSFPDVPEAHTFGETDSDALKHAGDVLVTALEAYMKNRRPVPRPSSDSSTGYRVLLPALTAAKVELYEAMRQAGIRKSDLARRLRLHAQQVDRLLDLHHSSRVDQLEAALGALNRELHIATLIRGSGLRPEVPVPRRISAASAHSGVPPRAQKAGGKIVLQRYSTSRRPTGPDTPLSLHRRSHDGRDTDAVSTSGRRTRKP